MTNVADCLSSLLLSIRQQHSVPILHPVTILHKWIPTLVDFEGGVIEVLHDVLGFDILEVEFVVEYAGLILDEVALGSSYD